ncbi:uncharacterized protein Triagg1_3221 [Trichoderma aggressivum f. europaeum]|uniref:CCHC-type domain-containing protein n=1 Tax=Trichoderma aggressivum f. europaeum TaxID=173218 RepID=A0AAE1M0L6_9HYPO|nr:hypothetical protein Triagg1_3221 [Trichoderma aggressivum f. europaeum]
MSASSVSGRVLRSNTRRRASSSSPCVDRKRRPVYRRRRLPGTQESAIDHYVEQQQKQQKQQQQLIEELQREVRGLKNQLQQQQQWQASSTPPPSVEADLAEPVAAPAPAPTTTTTTTTELAVARRPAAVAGQKRCHDCDQPGHLKKHCPGHVAQNSFARGGQKISCNMSILWWCGPSAPLNRPLEVRS